MQQETSGSNVVDAPRISVSGAGSYSQVLCGVMLPTTDSSISNGTISRTWDPNQTGFNPFAYSIGSTDTPNQSGSIAVRCYKDIGSTSAEFGKVSSPQLIASCSTPYSCTYPTGQNNSSCNYYCQALSGPSLDITYSMKDRLNPSAFGTCNFTTPGGTPSSGSGATFTSTYATAGTKIGTASCNGKTATCQADAVQIAPTCSANASNVLLQNGQAQVTFTAGGGGSGSYAWTTGSQDGATPVSGSSQNFTTVYSTPGLKTATITRGTGGSGSCQVRVEGTSASPVVCQPGTQTVSLVNGQAQATFTASGGSAPYSWSNSQGSPASGSGSSFAATFTTAGTKQVTVSGATGGSANCSVTVVTGTSAGSCDINRLCADRNEGIMFNVASAPAGKKVFSFMKKNGVQANPYPRLETGVTPYSATARYSIPANHGVGEIAQYEVYFGVGDTDNPSAIQALTTPTQYTVADCRVSNATLEVCPASQSVEIGEPAIFNAYYDSTGELPGNCTAIDQKLNVSGIDGAAWTSSNSAVATPVLSVGGVFNTLAAGGTTIQAVYGGVTAQGFLTITNPSDNLSATFTAVPSTGEAPLSSTLTATITSTGTATKNYKFWWNCPNYSPAANPTFDAARSACGDPTDPAKGARFDGSADQAKAVFHTYQSAGTYAPAVLIEQGTSVVFVKQTINATQATLACNSFTSSPTNYVCLNASCTSTRPPENPTLSWGCTASNATKCEVRTATGVVCSNQNPTDTCNPTKPKKTTRYELWCDGKNTGKATTIRVFDTSFVEIPP